jgi:hypothetical protein
MVVGDSVLRKVGAEYAVMMVECFPGIKTEHLQSDRKGDLDSPETVIHLDANDLRTATNLDFIMEVYAWGLRQR